MCLIIVCSYIEFQPLVFKLCSEQGKCNECLDWPTNQPTYHQVTPIFPPKLRFWGYNDSSFHQFGRSKFITCTSLNIMNRLVHLLSWTKPFIIFRGKFQNKIIVSIVNSADHDQTAGMCQLVCTDCMDRIRYVLPSLLCK
jgi:hypothetical protein